MFGDLLFSILNFCLLTCFCLPTIGNQQEVSFENEILPIFRQHCFECHGEGNSEGELSLESVSAMIRGGHTGSPILSADLGNSELYLRITSLSEGYRMPKRAKSLPQRDIEKIAQWIKQVSTSIPDDQFVSADLQENPVASASRGVASGSAGYSFGNSSQSTSLLQGMQPAQLAMFAIGAAVILFLVFALFYGMTDRSGKRKYSRHIRKTTASMAMLIGVVSSILLVSLGYFYWRTGELIKENYALRAELRSHNPVMPPTIEVSKSNLPMPPHPMHPQRLGGQYYRGNDERNELLFNGGFYRTATIDLHLVDSKGNRLKWGSDAKDDLLIEVTIQRAPNATKELFSERVHNLLTLQHYCQTRPMSNCKMKFEVVKKDDLWTAKVPLPKFGQWEENQAEGMIYLMYGVQPGEKQAPRPHFAVRYDLQQEGDRISNESELWMGSMYTLGNRVLVPEGKKILLDRWFDWRPIPVIVGEASTDPKLLGTDDHLGDQ